MARVKKSSTNKTTSGSAANLDLRTTSLDEIVAANVFTEGQTLRTRSSFSRDDGNPINYALVNIADWCKNMLGVVRQLRINTDNSHHLGRESAIYE